MEWQSNATWSNKGFEHTKDRHPTKERAEAACKLLMDEYSRFTPCPTRGVCLQAWTTEIKDSAIKKIKLKFNTTPKDAVFFRKLKKWEEDSTNSIFQVCGKIKS